VALVRRCAAEVVDLGLVRVEGVDGRVRVRVGVEAADGDRAHRGDEAVVLDRVVDAQTGDLVERVGEDLEALQGAAAGGGSTAGRFSARASFFFVVMTRSVAARVSLPVGVVRRPVPVTPRPCP
jgi:hypothetical protein